MDVDFKEKRRNFYSTIADFWPDLYEAEYSLYDISLTSETERTNKRLFAFRCGKIFYKMADLLSNEEISDETLMDLGYPEESLQFIRLKTMKNKTIIGRFDSVTVDGEEKLLEFNSDTPTFIKELFHVNQRICDEFGYLNPNKNEEEKLSRVLYDSIIGECLKINEKELPHIVFTSDGNHKEDRETVRYLQKLSGVPSRYEALKDLTIIEGEALLDSEGKKIDLLYRQTYPIENLLKDEDPVTGDNVGLMLLDLVAKEKLRIINPPSAFLLQNKAVMAVIWALHEERSTYFTEEEHRWIEQYFLPTYLECTPFRDKGEVYVKKPVFGREGDTVEIYHADGKKVMEDKNKSYKEYLSVYQKYVDLPKTRFITENGTSEGHIMTGTFLLNGMPSAYGFRAGNQITDNLSYYLPCGIEKKNDNDRLE